MNSTCFIFHSSICLIAAKGLGKYIISGDVRDSVKLKTSDDKIGFPKSIKLFKNQYLALFTVKQYR
ncbi:hypothetical protein H1P_220035 [Hyella patelloides LEGE 07179]|uniref:Uncharacterized protein n=1 Tax=Hyella patelloides LEGE 07179 TaxID=945734 RepID=A0A563VQX0_9CYAN|nr:hypothetical protein H1P_220035 [Hyella patelloides LEGE 07179]